ncbi:MAG TPA: hypothetical protein VHT73_11130 [Thermodesulfobacteriota bacterium]|nr:hypothetical protein [Thermodesulfobacteriota bacterium]
MGTQVKEGEEKEGKGGTDREGYSSYIEVLDAGQSDLQLHFLGAIPLIEVTRDFPLQSLGAIPLIVDRGDLEYAGKVVYPLNPKWLN